MLQKFQALPLGVRLVLATALPFGLYMGLLILFGGDLTPGRLTGAVVGGLAAGLIYGVSMTVFAGVSQVFTTSKGGKESADLQVRQKRTLFVLGSREQVYEELREALGGLGVRRFDIADPEAGVLTGHTAWSWKSFGENMSAVIKQVGEVCEVTITSEPRLPTTMVDYGKNRGNIERIEHHLRDQVQLCEASAEADRAADPADQSTKARATAQSGRAIEGPGSPS
jgi:hypothetical protein